MSGVGFEGRGAVYNAYVEWGKRILFIALQG